MSEAIILRAANSDILVKWTSLLKNSCENTQIVKSKFYISFLEI